MIWMEEWIQYWKVSRAKKTLRNENVSYEKVVNAMKTVVALNDKSAIPALKGRTIDSRPINELALKAIQELENSQVRIERNKALSVFRLWWAKRKLKNYKASSDQLSDAMATIVELKDKTAVLLLLDRQLDEWPVSEWAERAIKELELSRDEMIDFYLEALRFFIKPVSMRSHIIYKLGSLHAQKACEPMLDLLQESKEEDIFWAVINAFKDMRDDRIIDFMINKLSDRNYYFRHDTIRELKYFQKRLVNGQFSIPLRDEQVWWDQNKVAAALDLVQNEKSWKIVG